MAKKIYYFGYGSNLNTLTMSRRCGYVKVLGRGILNKNRLVYYYWADVEADPKRWVEGMVYQITPKQLEDLDASEEIGKTYIRTKEKIYLDNGELIDAWVYRMTRGGREHYYGLGEIFEKIGGKASGRIYLSYMREILINATELKFSDKYLEYLGSLMPCEHLSSVCSKCS